MVRGTSLRKLGTVFPNQVSITISDTPIINKHVSYTVKKADKTGEGSFTRRYTEYLAFRRKLV